MTKREQVLERISKLDFERSEKKTREINVTQNATSKTKASKTTVLDLIDMIMLESDWDIIVKTRIMQSKYVKNITKYNNMPEAAYNNNINNIRWLYKRGSRWTLDKSGKIGKCKNLEIINFLNKHDFIWHTPTVVTAIEYSNEILVEFLYDNVFTEKDERFGMLEVALFNDIDIITFMYKKMKPMWNINLLKHAIQYGCEQDKTEIAEYLIYNRCPCDVSIFVTAIKCGSLSIFKSLDMQYNCANKQVLIDTAIRYRQKEILEYIQENML
jgi:hypothetical protein